MEVLTVETHQVYDRRDPRRESIRHRIFYENVFWKLSERLITVAKESKIQYRKRACTLILELGKDKQKILTALRALGDVTNTDPEDFDYFFIQLNSLMDDLKSRKNKINALICDHNRDNR